MMLTPKIKALSAKESESRAALRDMLEMQRKERPLLMKTVVSKH